MRPRIPYFSVCIFQFVFYFSLSVAKPHHPFEAPDLGSFDIWLKESHQKDPEQVFRLKDGVLHITGHDRGYIATKQSLKDYHLSVEYKWGKKTDGGRYVRNSGIMLHGGGPHGASSGVWMASLEVQLAQGCEGDFIVIHGQNGRKVDITCNTRTAKDGRTRWDPRGKPTPYSGRQFWWNLHQPGFKELLDTRGRDDVASPLGKWTRVECICRGDRVSVLVNGTKVNEAYKVFPQSGRICLQNEGHEVLFRNMTITTFPNEDQ